MFQKIAKHRANDASLTMHRPPLHGRGGHKDKYKDKDKDPMYAIFLNISGVNLTIAHLRIALLGGNPEVGNSEYINHQNCPPQLT